MTTENEKIIPSGSLQVKNGIYYTVINLKDENGKRKAKWETTGLPERGNKKKAENILKERCSKYAEKKYLANSDITFADYMETVWLPHIKHFVEIDTYEGYEAYSRTHIIPYFRAKGIKMCEMTKRDVQDFVDFKLEKGRLDGTGGLSVKTVRELKNIMSSAFSYELDNEENSIVSKNPCAKVRLPKRDIVEPKFYTAGEVTELLKAIQGDEIYNFVILSLILGTRRSETLGLKWDAIDFENNTITIKHTLMSANEVYAKDRTKNSASYRTYPMDETVRNILLEIKKSISRNKKLCGDCYKKSDYVFVHADGSQMLPDYVTHHFSKLLKKHNLPHIRLHDLRHTCASLMINEGFQIKDIQAWLGHSSIQTTANIYGHLDVERKKSIGNSLATLVLGA